MKADAFALDMARMSEVCMQMCICMCSSMPCFITQQKNRS